ncbi:MAG: DUF4199 domain-containing protein [Prevotella sp.]|nr:DUF4199 domain-containing protein [Prevotella sp.]
MTSVEYTQLRAFARNDGAFLGIMWIASFFCSVLGQKVPLMGTLGLAFALLTPFFIIRRIRTFRDRIREGELSFWGGYIYSTSMFFYAALLLALAQFVYFAYIDKGNFLMTMLDQIEQMLIAGKYPEAEVKDSISQMRSMRPIDWSLYFLSMNIITGFVVSIAIAWVTRGRKIEADKSV